MSALVRDADIGRQTRDMIQSVRHDARFACTAPQRADAASHLWSSGNEQSAALIATPIVSGVRGIASDDQVSIFFAISIPSSTSMPR